MQTQNNLGQYDNLALPMQQQQQPAPKQSCPQMVTIQRQLHKLDEQITNLLKAYNPAIVNSS